MPRVLKLAAAAAGAALFAAAAFLLRPRQRDEALAGRVRLALSTSCGETARGIDVRARRGVVTLRGEVDELGDITRLERAVRATGDTVDVDNLLRLRMHPQLLSEVLSA